MLSDSNPINCFSGFFILSVYLSDHHSHLTLLLSVARYMLSYITFNYYSSSSKFAYRLAFISAAATYGIVVYKGHIARGRLQGAPHAIAMKLIADENVQYLCE